MKKILWILLVLILAIYGCNRFEKTFQIPYVPPPQTPEEFTTEFLEIAVDALKESNIEPLMEFYRNDYDNNGITKEEMRDLFLSEVWTDSVNISMEEISTNRYMLTLSDPAIGYIHEWEDKIERYDMRYYWVGIPTDNPPPPLSTLVIAQYLTYLTCQSCPEAKRELMSIEEEYPDSFLYLAYHSHAADPLSLYTRYAEERRYWGEPNAPYVLFQGRYEFEGIGSGTLENYKPTVDNILENPEDIYLSDLRIESIEGRTIEGSVVVSMIIDIDLCLYEPSDLYLYYVVYEKETDYTYQYGAGLHAGNVVRGRDKKPIDTFGEPISFTLLAQTDLDIDCYLVAWVQRIADINRWQAGDQIYNAIQIKIEN